jgi:hypothetical protein
MCHHRFDTTPRFDRQRKALTSPLFGPGCEIATIVETPRHAPALRRRDVLLTVRGGC